MIITNDVGSLPKSFRIPLTCWLGVPTPTPQVLWVFQIPAFTYNFLQRLPLGLLKPLILGQPKIMMYNISPTSLVAQQ